MVNHVVMELKNTRYMIPLKTEVRAQLPYKGVHNSSLIYLRVDKSPIKNGKTAP